MNYIQAYIVNMGFPSNLDLLASCVGGIPDPITNSIEEIRSTTDYYLEDEDDEDSYAIYIVGTGTLEQYSAPRHAMIGDICFLMCQRTAMQTYTRLRKEAYDLCETNVSYQDFCKWITQKQDFEDNVKKHRTSIYSLFYKEHEYYPYHQSNDIVLVECKSTDRVLDNNNYTSWNEIGFNYSNYQRVLQLIKREGYRYVHFKHRCAGAILFNLFWLNDTAQSYSGKIYAVGVVGSPPEQYNFKNKEKWSYGIITDFERCFLLDSPIDYSEFKDTVSFSHRGTFTSVLGPAFDNLKSIIASRNEVPDYFVNSVAIPIPLSQVDDSNWLEITNQHRRNFCLEDQFRVYYVNKLLPLIGDKKSFYMECKCFHRHRHYTQVDNVIMLGGKYLPVEVKLSIAVEKDLLGQCNSYCGCERIELKDKDVYMTEAWQNVLVIDRDGVYMYSPISNQLKSIANLDNITNNKDINNLRTTIMKSLD
ncbi:hypothetical protein SAMN02910456_02609 [Ruminococcaceae bacterium YRB3002]|nr:hypothetical protein SAMN02910456_02609 [Ruminococcaceae bacterium YRB3002]